MSIDHVVSKLAKEMPPSGIRRFFDIASEMKDVISMSVGEPDFVTPWNIRVEAIRSLEQGMTHYTSNSGMIELRELIVAYLQQRFSVQYDVADVLVTVGASQALDLAFRAVLDPGDEVLIPAPSYVSYEPGVRLAYGVPVPIVTTEAEDFVLTPESVERAITDKSKAIVVPYPNNPTGAIMTREQLEDLKVVIDKHGLFVIADEIYAELTYGDKHASIARGYEENTLLISGFSKAFAMTGWRLGYVAGPAPVIAAMLKIHQYTMLCAPVMSQVAGIEGLRHEMQTDYAQVEDMRRSYNSRRVYVLEALRAMGFSCFEPWGAFYVFPNISSSGLTSEQFCKRLLLEKHVACVPGAAFGLNGEGYMRCSYATSMENIKEAMARIAEFTKELDAGK